METLTIEISTPKARRLIGDLVDLDIISLKPTYSDDDTTWLNMAASSPSFAFLHDEAEDIYTATDGIPMNHEK